MRTVLTIKEQNAWISNNWINCTLQYHHAKSGMSHWIKNARGDKVHTCGGCGFDVCGSLLGDYITEHFMPELLKLSKKLKWTSIKDYQSTETFYGIHRNKKTKVLTLDGACGMRCMEDLLIVIGFSLSFVGESLTGNIYKIVPLTAHDRKYSLKNK